MSRLEQLINELCPNGVEYISLGEILINNNASDSVSKNDYKEVGKIPIIDQSQAYIAAYTDNKSAVPPAFPCIIFGDHTRVVKYADKKFAQGDSGTKVFIPVSDDINAKYIYYAFCNLNIPSRGYNRHWTIVKDITIPLPPLPVQEEIVRILDNFTELIAELTAELTARKKQYEYYRDNLLSNPNATFEPLVTLADIGTGSSNTNEGLEVGNYPLFVRSQEVRRKNEFQFDETAIITSGDGVGVGKIFHYIEGKYALHQRAYRIHITSDRLIPKFFFYYMKTSFLKYIEKNAVNSSVTSVRRPMMDKFPVPLPSIEEQQRIVNILNRFDTLCNDISNGLPAEIKQRKQQYEYYRNKLLTFSKAEIEV